MKELEKMVKAVGSKVVFKGIWKQYDLSKVSKLIPKFIVELINPYFPDHLKRLNNIQST